MSIHTALTKVKVIYLSRQFNAPNCLTVQNFVCIMKFFINYLKDRSRYKEREREIARPFYANFYDDDLRPVIIQKKNQF